MPEEEVLKIYDYAKKIIKQACIDDYFIYLNDLLENNFYKSLTIQEFFKQYVWIIFTCGFNASIVRKNWETIKKVLYEFNVEKVSKMTEEELLERIPIKNKQKISSIIKGSQLITNPWLDVIRTASSSEQIKAKLIKLPHIGNITVYHLMRNIGIDCYKPDRHIVNISKMLNMDTEKIFDIIIKKRREKYIGIADYILWRASSMLGVKTLIHCALNNKPIPKMNITKQKNTNDFML